MANTAIWTGYQRMPEAVLVIGPYAVPTAMPDEYVIELRDGSTLAVRGRELSPHPADEPKTYLEGQV